MTQSVGQSVNVYLKEGVKDRYFYGLYRTDEGMLYLGRVDQLARNDSIQVNNPGASANDFTDFDQGYDFFEGRDLNHEKVFLNLRYEQFRWDDVNLDYFINDDGELCVRVNSKKGEGVVTYPDVSERVDSVVSPFTFDKEAYTFDDSDITFDRG